MVIGLLMLEMHIPGARSLKDKRHVLRGLEARIRKRFNVSVAEVEHHDLWQRARLAVVAVNTDRSHLDATLDAVAREAASSREAELVDQQVEVL
jgi:uncharacterized protein YlxP (DUF503 family)